MKTLNIVKNVAKDKNKNLVKLSSFSYKKRLLNNK